jgi:hypothetical protein
MPRNNTKYKYYTVTLRLDSWTLAQLEQDADVHQMEDIPARLITVRLTDYYKLVASIAPVSGLTPSMAETPTVSSEQRARANTAPSPAVPVAKEPEADESADYWGVL